jgi:hypothetical protein
MTKSMSVGPVRRALFSVAIVVGVASCADEGASERSAEEYDGAPEQLALTYQTCSGEQMNRLATANWAVGYHIDGITEGVNIETFVEFFGVHPLTSEGYVALERLVRIRDLAAGGQMEFVCVTQSAHPNEYEQCDLERAGREKARAFVSGDAQRVFLCPRFWSLPTSHNDYGDQVSQVGALIHEYAHLAGAHRSPEIYYESPTQDLARTSPAQAIFNADNYRMFVMRDRSL